MKKQLRRLRLLAVISLGGIGTYSANALDEILRLEATVPERGDGFGMSLDSHGSLLVVGAPGISDFNDRESYGSVYIYEISETGPILKQTIPGPTDSLDRRFGYSVAAGEGFFAVASSNNFSRSENPRAAIYFFKENEDNQEWELAQVLEIGDDSLSSADQTIELLLEGGSLFVGLRSFEKVCEVQKVGANWQVIESIEDPNSSFFDSFGSCLAADGDRLVIGAVHDDTFGTNEGAIRFYTREATGWQLQQTMAPTALSEQFWFGAEADLSGEWLAVSDSGEKVSIYRWNEISASWEGFQLLSGGSGGVTFSGSMLLLGDTHKGRSSGEVKGFVYSETQSRWLERCQLEASISENYAEIGGAISVGERFCFVGAGSKGSGYSPSPPSGRLLVFPNPVFKSYHEWSTEHFSEGELVGLDASKEAVLNGFGLNNWDCYLRGVHPLKPGEEAFPEIVWRDETPIFQCSLPAWTAEKEVEFQVSDDLTNWNSVLPANSHYDFTTGRRQLEIFMSAPTEEGFFRYGDFVVRD